MPALTLEALRRAGAGFVLAAAAALCAAPAGADVKQYAGLLYRIDEDAIARHVDNAAGETYSIGRYYPKTSTYDYLRQTPRTSVQDFVNPLDVGRRQLLFRRTSYLPVRIYTKTPGTSEEITVGHLLIDRNGQIVEDAETLFAVFAAIQTFGARTETPISEELDFFRNELAAVSEDLDDFRTIVGLGKVMKGATTSTSIALSTLGGDPTGVALNAFSTMAFLHELDRIGSTGPVVPPSASFTLVDGVLQTASTAMNVKDAAQLFGPYLKESKLGQSLEKSAKTLIAEAAERLNIGALKRAADANPNVATSMSQTTQGLGLLVAALEMTTQMDSYTKKAAGWVVQAEGALLALEKIILTLEGLDDGVGSLDEARAILELPETIATYAALRGAILKDTLSTSEHMMRTTPQGWLRGFADWAGVIETGTGVEKAADLRDQLLGSDARALPGVAETAAIAYARNAGIAGSEAAWALLRTQAVKPGSDTELAGIWTLRQGRDETDFEIAMIGSGIFIGRSMGPGPEIDLEGTLQRAISGGDWVSFVLQDTSAGTRVEYEGRIGPGDRIGGIIVSGPNAETGFELVSATGSVDVIDVDMSGRWFIDRLGATYELEFTTNDDASFSATYAEMSSAAVFEGALSRRGDGSVQATFTLTDPARGYSADHVGTLAADGVFRGTFSDNRGQAGAPFTLSRVRGGGSGGFALLWPVSVDGYSVENAHLMSGEPDLRFSMLFDTGATARFTAFSGSRSESPEGLATLLGLDVTELRRGDVIAFECNGSLNVPFESSRWRFMDGSPRYMTSPFETTHDFDAPDATSALVAYGNIPEAAYRAHFRITGGDCGGDIAWVLFELPEDFDTHSVDVVVEVARGETGSAVTPDPDTLAVLAWGRPPEAPATAQAPSGCTLILSGVLDDHYGSPGAYLMSVAVDGTQVLAAQRPAFPHGQPYASVFENWTALSIPLTGSLPSGAEVEVTITHDGSPASDWIGIDSMTLRCDGRESFQELSDYGNYGALDSASGIVYGGQSKTWGIAAP